MSIGGTRLTKKTGAAKLYANIESMVRLFIHAFSKCSGALRDR